MMLSAGAGLRRGLEAIPGQLGDLPALGRAGTAWAAGKLGASPETQKAITDYDIPVLPNISTENIHDFTTNRLNFGESYEPQTTAGKYTRSAAEFAPAFLSNPYKGGAQLLGRVAIGAGAGLASEAAGQATEGTAAEPWARAGAGILAGGAGLGALEGTKGAITKTAREAEAAAEDDARRFGVNLTKGERTGNVTQQIAEQQMLRGSRGDLAQRMLQGRADANKAALDDAMNSIMDRVAPTRGTDAVQAGDLLNQSIRDRVKKLRAKGSAGIESVLQNTDLMIDADQLRGLPKTIRQNLAGPTPYVPDVVLGPNTPIANEAMDRLRSFSSQARNPNVKEFSLAGAENLRQRLTELQAQPGSIDARALGKIQKHLDDWFENAVGSTGDDTALATLKEGRETYREGARIDRPRANERKENPGAVALSEVARTNHPEDTARLFSPNNAGVLSQRGLDALDRLVETKGSSGELDQVRGIVLDSMKSGGPQKRASRLRNLIEKNPSVVDRLFTPADTGELQGYVRTNERLVPDPRATNPSGTSYPVIKEMGKLADKATEGSATAFGGVLGGVPGAVLGYVGSKGLGALKAYGNLTAAKEALSPADRRALARIIIEAGAKGGSRAIPGTLAGQEK
jgi:hypothetical protein